MRKLHIFLLLLLCQAFASAQQVNNKINAEEFFTDETTLNVTLGVNLRTVIANKNKKDVRFPAKFSMNLDDGSVLSEPVELAPRGNFRKEYCQLPPLKIDFKSPASPRLSPLGTLKLVNVCFSGGGDNTEYLLKEFLVYKMYNLITEKSLRVRLLKITFADSSSKRKPMVDYAFLIEDVKDMAKRNSCMERKRPVAHTELTNREQMTKVAMFQYMIGNLDWSVKALHNIRLIAPKDDTSSVCFAVPYDFDYCGLVKTDYALPPEQLNVKDVTERSYMGFARTLEEVEATAAEFIEKKEKIYQLINEFELLPERTRKNMISFLDDFYRTIREQKRLKAEFINNARSQK